MTDWIAVTQSGTIWEYTDGIMHVKARSESRVGDQTFKPISIKTVDVSQDFTEGFWPTLRALPDAELPVVGESLYASGFSEWRLSTPVASFEVLDDAPST